ncbi:hypothetical protein [Longirhabdus pacifica]|uniref:hypothetical protein n=1 Tax=Longirhabdus pacifica TaxID=2305227 RepID=UPI00197E260D|nr:hypothetical protein [Longirhabdus pacifica]
MKAVLFIVEIMRILVILFLGMFILTKIEIGIYELIWKKEFIDINYYLMWIGNVLVIFLVYRNKLQFSGWYKSNVHTKISGKWLWMNIGIVTICIGLGLFIH